MGERRSAYKAPWLFSSQSSTPQRPMMSFTVSLLQCTSNSQSYILTTIEERAQEEPGPRLKDTVQQPSPKFGDVFVCYVRAQVRTERSHLNG